MREAVTLVFVLVVLTVVLWRLWAANRRAAEKARLAKERREKERELLARVQRIKKRDDLSAAAAAIDKDPARAARVVSRMMKDDQKNA